MSTSESVEKSKHKNSNLIQQLKGKLTRSKPIIRKNTASLDMNSTSNGFLRKEIQIKTKIYCTLFSYHAGKKTLPSQDNF